MLHDLGRRMGGYAGSPLTDKKDAPDAVLGQGFRPVTELG